MRAASLIKLPIYEEMVRAVERQTFTWKQTVRFKTSDRVGGSGYFQFMEAEEWTLAEWLTAMIAGSDNQATNGILRLLGFSQVQEMLRKESGIVLGRKMMDTSSKEENWISARAAVACWRRIEQLNQQMSRDILTPFRQQQFREGLPGLFDEQGLPGLTILNKTGRLDGIEHDVAAFQLGEQTVWLAVLTEDCQQSGQGISLLREMGRQVVYLLKQRN